MKNYLLKNKNLNIFLVCLLLALSIWASMSLSRKYSQSFYFDVAFTNTPLGKKIVNDNIILKTSVEASGWDLLFKRFKNRKIIVDLSEYPQEENIQFTNTKDLVQEKLSDLNIKEVSPLFFTLVFQKLESKKVPIKAVFNKNFKANYFFKQKPELSLDSVIISSDKETLQKITEINTEPAIITEEDTLIENLALIIPTEVQLSTTKINIKLNSEEYIEKQLTVPITIDNRPENKDLIIYPEKIQLKCLVPISIYENISASDFYISADFNNIEVQNNSKLILILKNSPESIKNIQLEKDEVEFIIYQ